MIIIAVIIAIIVNIAIIQSYEENKNDDDSNDTIDEKDFTADDATSGYRFFAAPGSPSKLQWIKSSSKY